MYKQPYTIPKVEIERADEELFIQIKDAPETDLTLYVGNTPDVITQPIANSITGLFSVELPVAEGPYYFVAKSETFSTEIFSERVLQLNGARNIRDMGGYRTNDGKIVKWGLLFRGDHLKGLDQQDTALLEKMNIKSIVDYRSEHEQLIYPNKEIATVVNTFHCDPKSSFSECSANAVDLKSENEKLVNELKEGKVDPKFVNDKGDNVKLGYKELVISDTAKAAYSKFLKICADSQNVPLIHHCRGGKDRTGLGSMFLLLLLNVREEDIVKDYVLTGIIRKERNQLKYEQYCQLTDNKDYLDYLMTILATREDFIMTSIQLVKDMYPSIEEFMIQHFGLTQEEINQAREFYLEPSSAYTKTIEKIQTS